MLQQPKVGDTVVLRAIVVSINTSGSYNTLKLKFIDCDKTSHYHHFINVNRVHEVIPAPPPAPKVGDKVYLKARNKMYPESNLAFTLIHVHQQEGDNRKWGVIAYAGDIPKSVYFEDLRLER